MDSRYMKRAIELAKKGRGYVSPNPLVGAVIVKDGKIIGEGYHERYGSRHAEINAILNSQEDPRGATMYVTLEPCSHHGKTAPCAERLIEEKIGRVVIASKDPNPQVAGRGIELLKKAGIDVELGLLEDESRKLNEIFFKYIKTKEPFVLMKTAMTLDGKIATKTGDSKWITGEEARNYVHHLRHEFSGIMVGLGTVLADNPSLTTRLEGINGSDPTRIIVDSLARIPLDSKVLNLESSSKTIVAVTSAASPEKLSSLKNKGAKIIVTPPKNGRVDLNFLVRELGSLNIDSILLEGGGELNYSALEAGIVDKVASFVAPKILGGSSAKSPVAGLGIESLQDAIELDALSVKSLGRDLVLEGYIRKEA